MIRRFATCCVVRLIYVYFFIAFILLMNYLGEEPRPQVQKVKKEDSFLAQKSLLRMHARRSVVQYEKSFSKIILLWENKSWFHAQHVTEPNQCGYCSITNDRSLLMRSETKAVVIDVSSDAFLNPPKNEYRRQDQLYVFWSMESPGRTRVLNGKKVQLQLYSDHYFNATMTFRRDSTFYTQAINTNYVKRPIDIIHSVDNRHNDIRHLLSMKKQTAVWFVSNCKSGSNSKKRLQISDEMLANGLKLDRYGKCFNNSKVFQEKNDFIRFLESYKFYLAFENSLHCRDYITEKFLVNALLSGLVPVVYGAVREDYEAIAPPHSFIHVEDFETIQELIDYLNYLDQNETAYAEYFAWRRLDPEDLYPYGRYMGLCALCRTLYGIPLDDKRPFNKIYNGNGERYRPSVGLPFRQTIRSIHQWWHGNETKECLNLK